MNNHNIERFDLVYLGFRTAGLYCEIITLQKEEHRTMNDFGSRRKYEKK